MTASAEVGVESTDGVDGDSGRDEQQEQREQVGSRYRLRDLGRRDRLMAAALAIALLLAPVLAFARTAPDWTPANDPALMALRSLDVGTSRTPVSGQPSQSSQYVEDLPTVTHLGPTHFYLMAIPVRLLGAATGMLVVSVAITGGSLLLMAWAVHRQLGQVAGFLAALALAAVTVANGTASLVNPISSSIAGYPMFCSMVLLWCLLCRDLRLLPLTAGVVSFALQQHLSVGPAMATALVLVGLMLVWEARTAWRSPENRRPMRRWAVGAGLVAAVLWTPVLLQQLFGGRGNLSTLWSYTTHDDRPTLGLTSAVHQVAHVVGLPSVLSQRDLNGFWLMGRPSAVTWVSAAAVLVLVLTAALRLWSSELPADDRRRGLVVLVLVLVVAGLVNGSSVPEGTEAPRLAFYHWVWPLTFFVLMVLGLAVISLLRGSRRRGPSAVARPWVAPTVVAVSVVAMVAGTVTGQQMQRYSNTLSATNAPLPRHHVEELADEVMAHREALGDQTLVVERGQRAFEWLDAALALELIERGIDVRLSYWFGRHQFVHADRMADRDSLDSGLVLVLGDPLDDSADEIDVPGELVASTETTELRREALEALVAQAEAADRVVLGEAMEASLAELGDWGAAARQLFLDLPNNARDLLRDTWAVALLRQVGIVQPRLDPELLDQLAASFGDAGYRQYSLDVYLLDRTEILAYAGETDLGPRR